MYVVSCIEIHDTRYTIHDTRYTKISCIKSETLLYTVLSSQYSKCTSTSNFKCSVAVHVQLYGYNTYVAVTLTIATCTLID